MEERFDSAAPPKAPIGSFASSQHAVRSLSFHSNVLSPPAAPARNKRRFQLIQCWNGTDDGLRKLPWMGRWSWPWLTASFEAPSLSFPPPSSSFDRELPSIPSQHKKHHQHAGFLAHETTADAGPVGPSSSNPDVECVNGGTSAQVSLNSNVDSKHSSLAASVEREEGCLDLPPSNFVSPAAYQHHHVPSLAPLHKAPALVCSAPGAHLDTTDRVEENGGSFLHTSGSSSSSTETVHRSSPPVCGHNQPLINTDVAPFSLNADTWSAFQCHFVAGGFSLALAYAFVHPLDTIRTRLQASSQIVERSGILSTLSRAVLNPSVMRSLLHGFSVSILGAGPQGAIRFSTYEYVKCKLLKMQAQRARETRNAGEFWHPFLTTAAGAAVGDVMSSVVKLPREVITQRLQTKQFTSGMDAIKCIFAEEGIRGLYRGWISTACRDIPFMAILFISFEEIKNRSNGLCHQYWVMSALAGAASGALAGFATTPFDMIKTKIMTQPAHVKSSMWFAARTIVNQQGVSALMRGCAPRSLWWFGVCGVFFPSYEHSKLILYDFVNHRHDEYVHYHYMSQLVT